MSGGAWVRRVVMAAFAAIVVFQPVIASAQKAGDYPSKPVRLVASSAPGGGIDIIGRLVAPRLTEAWGQQVVVDNRPGGGGVIAISIVTAAAPDGYTLLVGSVGISYVGTLRKDARFDVLRDLVPVAKVASQPSLLAVHASVPAANLAELLQLAKAKPGQLTFGTGGAGGAAHMGTELFVHAAGVKLVHVPYKGTGPSMAALLSAEVNMAMVGVATALPHVKAGKIKPIGVTGATRSAILPSIPTIAEAGVPGYEFAGWYAIFAPAKTPRAIVLKINADIDAALKQPEAVQRLNAMGFDPQSGSVDEFTRYFRSEVAKWKKVIREAGIAAS